MYFCYLLVLSDFLPRITGTTQYLVSNTIIVMPGLEELTARYERITEKIPDARYIMEGYSIKETKISYDIKGILHNWNNATMEDLDWIHSSVPRHIECLNELSKMLSEPMHQEETVKEWTEMKIR